MKLDKSFWKKVLELAVVVLTALATTLGAEAMTM